MSVGVSGNSGTEKTPFEPDLDDASVGKRLNIFWEILSIAVFPGWEYGNFIFQEFPMSNPFQYKPNITILLVLSFYSFIFPQNVVTVKGTIFDAQTMLGLSGANIYIEELKRGATSDEEGHFRLSSIPQGEFTISASYVGYRVSKQDLITRNTAEVSLTIMLMPTILEGQSIEVTATRAVEGETPVSFTNVSREELSEKYTASDIPMMLEDLPGIYSYSLTGDNLGYSLVEVLSPCPTNWKMSPIESWKWVDEVMSKEFPLGVIKDTTGEKDAD